MKTNIPSDAAQILVVELRGVDDPGYAYRLDLIPDPYSPRCGAPSGGGRPPRSILIYEMWNGNWFYADKEIVRPLHQGGMFFIQVNQKGERNQIVKRLENQLSPKRKNKFELHGISVKLFRFKPSEEEDSSKGSFVVNGKRGELNGEQWP